MGETDMNDTAAPTAPATVKATIANSYRWRLAVIGIGFTLFGLYCLYDGFIGWPEQKRVWDQYQDYLKTHSQAEWAALAKEQGLPEQPKERNDWGIYSQFIMAAIVFPIGIIFTTGFIRSINRHVAMDESGLSTNAGLRCRFDQIASLDNRRWKTKGIALVHFKDDAGATRTILLDDWKFHREPTTIIYNRVAQHLGVTDDSPANTATEPG